jgi:hypothetical protein
VHDDVEVLDFCGPFEAFGVTGDDGRAHFNVFTVADEARIVRANTGMLIQPNHTRSTTVRRSRCCWSPVATPT